MLIALQVVQFETAVGIPANCSVGKQPRRRGRINRFFIIPCIVLPVRGLPYMTSEFFFYFPLSPSQISWSCSFCLLFLGPPTHPLRTSYMEAPSERARWRSGWGERLDSINSSFIFFFYSEMLSPKQIHLCIFHLLFPPIAEKKTEVLIRFPPLSPRAMNEIPGGNVSMAG